jgi:hypothetical protein
MLHHSSAKGCVAAAVELLLLPLKGLVVGADRRLVTNLHASLTRICLARAHAAAANAAVRRRALCLCKTVSVRTTLFLGERHPSHTYLALSLLGSPGEQT